MREIVLDTETTGRDPYDGDHRIVEIGCVELFNHIPTGRTYHQYINPQRDVPAEVVAVHGLTEDYLKDFPTFAEIVGDFIEFIQGGTLVIHNAPFDVKFINAEFKKLGFPPLDNSYVFDTLDMARRKFPGSPASLDALCRRFNIDNSNRTLHGALLDSEILAEVYLEMLGGRQHGLSLDANATTDDTTDTEITPAAERQNLYMGRQGLVLPASEKEMAAHKDMAAKLKDPLWDKPKNA